MLRKAKTSNGVITVEKVKGKVYSFNQETKSGLIDANGGLFKFSNPEIKLKAGDEVWFAMTLSNPELILYNGVASYLEKV